MNLVYRNFKLDLREDGIAIFSANRPAVKNAMNIDAWKEFHAFLREAQRDDDIRVIILTGEGDAFISGADITEFQKTNHTDVLFFDSTDVVQLIEAGRKCSATRFLRNRDRIVEKKSPILRSISEARSLASTAPQQGERPTQEGGLF